jgi:GT2 family glycosyltransferase
MASDPSVGVVLVNHNGLRFLPECVRYLKADNYPRLEIIVVDNASTDDSIARVLADHPDVTVLQQHANLGFAEGTNAGVRHVLDRGHDYVLLLNNDTRVDSGFVAALVSVADRRTLVAPKSYDWASGRIVNSHVGEFDWVKGRLRERFFGQTDSSETRRLQEVGLADGACLLVPAEAFRELGLLDPSFFLYYEDWDFVVRAKSAGYRVLFQPTATLRHHERGTTGPTAISATSAYYTTRNRLFFMKKHSRSSWSYVAFLAYFSATRSLTLLQYLVRGRWHLAQWTVRGVADFLCGRTGPGAVTPSALKTGVSGQQPVGRPG